MTKLKWYNLFNMTCYIHFLYNAVRPVTHHGKICGMLKRHCSGCVGIIKGLFNFSHIYLLVLWQSDCLFSIKKRENSKRLNSEQSGIINNYQIKKSTGTSNSSILIFNNALFEKQEITSSIR